MAKRTENNQSFHWHCGCGGGYGVAILFIILGAFFVSRDLGWISTEVSFWPVALLAFGIYLLFRPRKKCY